MSRKSSPTPSSAIQPGGSVPSAIARRQTGARPASVSAWTDSEPGRKPRPGVGSGAPDEVVTPPWNQHIAPALRPARTTPRSQASRSIRSRPWTCQMASRLRIDPPPA
jgi:hypothetical protein